MECDGRNAAMLECRIFRPFTKPYLARVIRNRMSATIIFDDKNGTRTSCTKSGYFRKAGTECVFTVSRNVLQVRHPTSDFTKIVEIELEYCNVFGCIQYRQSFNRSSVETPRRVCITNSEALLGGFRYVINETTPVKVYGDIEEYCVTCKVNNESKEMCQHRKQSGKFNNLHHGATYQCTLKAIYPFSSKWSEPCVHSITTIGKEPARGPIYYNGMFSFEGDSKIRIFYAPPSFEHQNGAITEYGLSTSNSDKIEVISKTNMILTNKRRGLFYLFARNIYGWSINATKVVIPKEGEVLPSPFLELWKKTQNNYRSNVILPSRISDENVTKVIYVICDHKYIHCRTQLAPILSINAILMHEKVTTVIQTADNRSNSIKSWDWISHYCLKGTSARIKKDWIEADLIQGMTVQVKVQSSHMQCSPYSRKPLHMLNFTYDCTRSSQEYFLKRNRGEVSVLEMKFKSKSCRLFVQTEGGKFKIPIHESLPHLSKRSPSSNDLVIIGVIIGVVVGIVILAILMYLAYNFLKPQWLGFQTSKKTPIWSTRSSLNNTDVNYQTQGVEEVTEMTSLNSSGKQPNEEITLEIESNSLLSEQDSSLSNQQYIS